jgi:very-short-patch-repair endonuclease
MCHNNSFKSHPKHIYWSKKNKKSPRQVIKYSKKEYIFDCTCKHEFETALANITGKDAWCGYCSTPTLYLCDKEDCEQCYNNSFASISKSIYWSKKNKFKPRYVLKNSGKPFIFDCPECKNEYKAVLCSITNGEWCGCVKFKTEEKLYKFLTNECNLSVVRQKKFKWCKKENYLPFDFFIESLNILIELDGLSHFKQVANWTSPEISQERDRYKMDKIFEYGYSIIRIFQPDVWNDKNDWQANLLEFLKKYETPTNILIGKIYKEHPIYFLINNVITLFSQTNINKSHSFLIKSV